MHIRLNKALLSGILAGMALIIGLLFAVVTGSQDKIAFVRSADLINGFTSMQETQERFKEKDQQWRQNIETLGTELEKAIEQYESEKDALAPDRRSEREFELQLRREQYVHYAGSLGKKARQEQREMMQAALDKINAFVKDYGAARGYTMILGTTAEGNLLYGHDAADITEEVLKALNSYFGGAEASDES